MALPNPIPDNPLKWTGWKEYNSSNPYDRLCLDYSSNATTEMIEEHCRQMLVWWQKKLPLKNQPSNPMAQLLRQGLDEAPHFLAEARSRLLDPEQRKIIDSQLHAQVVGKAVDELRKLLGFTLADKRLTKESEGKLYTAGERLGLTRADIEPVIAAELELAGATRVVDEPPPPPAENAVAPAFAVPANGSNPPDEFRRILKMSRLCLEGEEMSDDQRDAMCNLGESLGLTGGQAEDLIDEYLEKMAAMPVAPPPKPVVPTRTPKPVAAAPPPKSAPAKQPAPKGPVAPPAAVPAKMEPQKEVNITPAGRAMERQKHPNFVSSIGAEMFLLPSGRFAMGSKAPGAQQNEQPITPITLSCFYISRFPITNAQYETFDPAHLSKRAPWADGSHPVVYVTWHDADAFCNWLGKREGKTYRLPTEAEWEYAARGDDGRMFPWGEWNPCAPVANFADASTRFPWRDPSINDGYAESSPVGSYPRGTSPFGIEDMAGNVFEWCLDCYEPYKGKESSNPRSATNGRQRVGRGGSWKSRFSSLRTTARGFSEPRYFSNDFGFRIVCECV